MPDRAHCESLRRSCSSVASPRVCEFRKGGRVSTGDYDFFRSAFISWRTVGNPRNGLRVLEADFWSVWISIVQFPNCPRDAGINFPHSDRMNSDSLPV